MTVTLELPPEVEAVARTVAQAKGMPIENYLQSFLEQQLMEQKPGLTEEEEHQAALTRIQSGYYARRLSSSEEFASQKADERALEERHWRR